jgi:alpha-L-fucosidase
MKVKQSLLLVSAVSLLLLVGCGTAQKKNGNKYEASWESLKQHQIPKWVKDSKYGIYAHWGIYSVGIGPPWTEKRLYNPDYEKGKLLEKFKELTGHELKDGYGYKDLIKYFKAENYDPVAWAELVKKSGAKFAGFSISHHDGFGLWDSDVYKWNVGKMGPKRDLYGDFVKELRKQKIKIYATSHMYRT